MVTPAQVGLHGSAEFLAARPGSGEDGEMHLISPKGWKSCVGKRLARLFVRADWLANAVMMVRRRPRLELTLALPGREFWLLLVSALFDTAWLAIWTLVAIRYHSYLAMFLASLPVMKWLLLLVARQPGERGRLEQPAVQTASESSPHCRPLAADDEMPGFLGEDSGQNWIGEREIAAQQVSGAVQE